MIKNIQPQDLPFIMFSLFSRGNKIEYLRIVFLVSRLVEESYQEAVPLDYFIEEAVKEDVCGPETNRDRIITHIRELSTSKLIRRQNIYDDEKQQWEESILLSGYGRRFITFVEDIMKDDIDETRDYKITSARRIMRDLLVAEQIPDNRADLLMSVFTSLRDLMYHLSGFSARFRDYIEQESKNIHVQNAKDAGDWIGKIMSSNYLREYYTVCDDSLGYVSQISEIAKNIKILRSRQDLTEMIVRDRMQKAKDLREKNGVDDISEEEIRRQISAQIRRIYSITNVEYVNYISQIRKTVNEIIGRIYTMYSAFGTGISGDSLRTRVMRFIRYVEETGDTESARDIMNLYQLRYFTEESLKAPNKKTDSKKEYQDPIYLFDTKIREGGPVKSRKREIRLRLEEVMDGQERIRLDSLPCGNDDEFCTLIRLVYAASQHDSTKKEFGTQFIEGEPRICTKGIYTIPNIYIVRCKRKRRSV